MNNIGVRKYNLYLAIGLLFIFIIFIFNIENIKSTYSNESTTFSSAAALAKAGIPVGYKKPPPPPEQQPSGTNSLVNSKQTIKPTTKNSGSGSGGITGLATSLLSYDNEEEEVPIIKTEHRIFNKEEYIDDLYKYTKIIYKQPNLLKTIHSSSSKPTILILSTISKHLPYGPDRTIADFIKTINSLIYDITKNQPQDTSKTSSGGPSNYKFSLGLSINSPSEFEELQKFIEINDVKFFKRFDKITLLSSPEMENQHEIKFENDITEEVELNRDNRHDDHKQRVRRRIIAKNRNFLISNSLEIEQFTLFLDSDIVKFDNSLNFIDILVNSNKDIIVPRIKRGDFITDYDRNSWKGLRTKPNEEQLAIMDSNVWSKFDYVPQDIPGSTWHFADFDSNPDSHTEEEKKLNHVVPLDSVGGAVLFFKSIIYKQGVIFPASYLIGTSWERMEGYDGIETEGVCYLAKPLGYSCWGMPNLNAYHVA
ncbi:hypothetical protein KGF54_005200 [Candida jiufengensis]|uniref:uncharacterized protein n=1 Tax=Candida jiufengensis TaxID=497108 RepID=UPI0022245C87|nr:uncharacterized protein KGF54_005200 [Candida jiufengensis]KAI5950243.1 hypothetical protein KGF54_005200 [Candida jiufengensis]